MDIEVKELKEKFDRKEDFVLIDVREPFENQEFNLGGTLIPLNNLPNHVNDLIQHKNEEVVIYCLSGNRSDTAKQYLSQSGFSNVRNLLGGVLDWIEKFGPEK